MRWRQLARSVSGARRTRPSLTASAGPKSRLHPGNVGDQQQVVRARRRQVAGERRQPLLLAAQQISVPPARQESLPSLPWPPLLRKLASSAGEA
jgi:hypothetical protein